MLSLKAISFLILILGVSRNSNKQRVDINEIRLSSNDTIHVVGTILAERPGYCGYFCYGGLIKVKLENKTAANISDILYIITACERNDIKVGTKVNLIATKLLTTDRECYYNSFAKLDTLTHTYYKLSEKESAKL